MPFLLKVSRTQKNWGMCDVRVVFLDLTKLLLYLHDNLNDIRWGKTHTRMGGSTTKIQLVFFWFYFTFQDLDHHPFFHHLAKKGSWAPTTKTSSAMNTNKKQYGALHQENMVHTGQDKLLSSIQDPSYEFQSGGKSATRVVSRGNWSSRLSAQFEENVLESDGPTRFFPVFFSVCFILVWLAVIFYETNICQCFEEDKEVETLFLLSLFWTDVGWR